MGGLFDKIINYIWMLIQFIFLSLWMLLKFSLIIIFVLLIILSVIFNPESIVYGVVFYFILKLIERIIKDSVEEAVKEERDTDNNIEVKE